MQASSERNLHIRGAGFTRLIVQYAEGTDDDRITAGLHDPDGHPGIVADVRGANDKRTRREAWIESSIGHGQRCFGLEDNRANAPARGVSDAKGPHRALNHCRSGSTSVIEDIAGAEHALSELRQSVELAFRGVVEQRDLGERLLAHRFSLAV